MSTTDNSTPPAPYPPVGAHPPAFGTAANNPAASLDPNDPPWGVLAAVFVWLASVALLFIIPPMAVVFYALRRGVELRTLKDFVEYDAGAIFVSVLAVLPTHLLTLGVVWALVTRFGTRPFWRTLGFSRGGPLGPWKSAGLAVALWLFGTLLVLLLGDQETPLSQMIERSDAARYALAALAVLTAPLVEEAVYRGVLYPSLQRRIGKLWATVGVLALFTIVHVPQYWPNVSVISAIGLLSLFLTWLRAYTGRLLPCVVVHTVFNSITAIGLILEPYLKQFAESGGQKSALVTLASHLFPHF